MRRSQIRLALRRSLLAAGPLLVLAASCGGSSAGSAGSASGTTRTVTVTVGKTSATTQRQPQPQPPASAIRTPSAGTRARLDCTQPCDDFQTPSTNIKCTAFGAPHSSVECDIGSGLSPKPSGRPCTFGDLVGLTVPPAGAARFACRSDVPLAGIDKHIPTLPYGTVWHGFGVFCVSQAAGLTCVNGDGHGFFLARERWTTF